MTWMLDSVFSWDFYEYNFIADRLCKVPDKLESLSLSGSAWIRFSGTSGNSENVAVVSIWLVGMCPCELILGCFQISRALRRKLQVCFVLQDFFFSLLSHSLLYIFSCGRSY